MQMKSLIPKERVSTNASASLNILKSCSKPLGLLALPIFFALAGQLTFAAGAGGDGSGGGDICENRFRIVANDIGSWLLKNGAKGLKLPASLTVQKYSAGMLKQISSAQVSCTDQPVMIEQAEKTCKNFVDGKGAKRIVCNLKRFMDTSENDQYVLVHHEYAGLARFEMSAGERSTYDISNQISGFLELQEVMKLAVNPSHTGKPTPLPLARHLLKVGEHFTIAIDDIDIRCETSYLPRSAHVHEEVEGTKSGYISLWGSEYLAAWDDCSLTAKVTAPTNGIVDAVVTQVSDRGADQGYPVKVEIELMLLIDGKKVVKSFEWFDPVSMSNSIEDFCRTSHACI